MDLLQTQTAVVHCLRKRYQKDMIYTNTGPILIALNPFKSCKTLYSDKVMKQYWKRIDKLLRSPEHVLKSYCTNDEQVADKFCISIENIMKRMQTLLTGVFVPLSKGFQQVCLTRAKTTF